MSPLAGCQMKRTISGFDMQAFFIAGILPAMWHLEYAFLFIGLWILVFLMILLAKPMRQCLWEFPSLGIWLFASILAGAIQGGAVVLILVAVAFLVVVFSLNATIDWGSK